MVHTNDPQMNLALQNLLKNKKIQMLVFHALVLGGIVAISTIGQDKIGVFRD